MRLALWRTAQGDRHQLRRDVAVDSIAGVRAPPRGCFFTRGPAHPGFGWPLAPTPCVGIPHRRGAAAPHAGCPPAARQCLPRESAPAAAGHPGPGGVRGDGRGRCPSAVDGRPPRHTPEVGVDDRLLDLGSLSLSLLHTPLRSPLFHAMAMWMLDRTQWSGHVVRNVHRNPRLRIVRLHMPAHMQH
jgi:hypothetical protein